MSVKIEPFIFGGEDNIQIDPEKLPGAFQKAEEEVIKTQAKPETSTEDKEEILNNPVDNVEEEEEDSYSDEDFFSKKDEKEEVKKEKLSSDKVDYKAFSDFLVESGIWKDYEGRDELEYNEESFQSLWKAQADNTAKQMLTEEREQFGGAANQLIDYLKDGGTVEDFTSNYTQQLEISSLDTTEEEGQEKAIKEYYKSLDWSDVKIKKHIDRVKDSGEEDFKEEADDCKTKLVSAIEEQRQGMIEEQSKLAQDRKIRIEKFNKSVRKVMYEDANLADREKKELDKFVYEYKYQDDNGSKYSEFMVKMNDINQDPTKYAKFLNFVKNFDSYEDKKVTTKEVKRKEFNFLKQGSNPLEGAQTAEVVKQKSKTPPIFTFK